MRVGLIIFADEREAYWVRSRPHIATPTNSLNNLFVFYILLRMLPTAQSTQECDLSARCLHEETVHGTELKSQHGSGAFQMPVTKKLNFQYV